MFGGLVDNSPLLLTAGPEILDHHLRQARISREELLGQLRSAGVHRLEQVTAVVLETTGDLRDRQTQLSLGVVVATSVDAVMVLRTDADLRRGP